MINIIPRTTSVKCQMNRSGLWETKQKCPN